MLKKKLSVCFAVIMLFAVINASATVQLEVYFKDEGIHENNIVKPRIYIKNVGTEAVSNFYYCYFMTVENGKTPTKQDYWMPNCTATLEQIDAIHYKVKYSYSGFTLTPGAVEPNLDGNCLGVYCTDWSLFNKSNDFSYTPTSTFQETNYIPVYNSSGILIHGTEPAFLSPIAGNEVTYPRLSKFVIYADSAITLGNSVTITGGYVGTNGYQEIGSSSTIWGNLYAKEDICLLYQTRIEGNVTTGGIVNTPNPPVTITGTRNENAEVRYIKLPTGRTFPDTNNNITVGAYTTMYLTPGNYNKITVNQNATIILNAGIYSMRTLLADNDVSIIIQTSSSQTTEINLKDTLKFGARNRMNFTGTGTAYNFRVYSNQTSQLVIGADSRICGVFAAPNAEISCAERVVVNGEMYGKRVTIGANSNVTRPTLPTGLAIVHRTDVDTTFSKALYKSDGTNMVDIFGSRDVRQSVSAQPTGTRLLHLHASTETVSTSVF